VTEAGPSHSGIYLARHGETDYNRHGRFQGWLPVGLNALGREQAAELARRAAGYDFKELWCSPLVRARETADIVAAQIGLTVREDARLAETDAGDWTDLTFEEVRAHDPDRFDAFVGADPGFAFPGGESLQHHSQRVMSALDDIARAPKPALVVCHGVVIRLALAALGQSIAGEAPGGAPVGNADLIALEG
jgi:broad specificity phosphatase PhoE